MGRIPLPTSGIRIGSGDGLNREQTVLAGRVVCADTAAMDNGHRTAAVVGLFVVPVLIGVGGCTGGSGRPVQVGGSRPVSQSATAAASRCTRADVKRAIDHFFGLWNERDSAAFGRLFSLDGVLQMATKHQDSQSDQQWTTANGPRAITAFAKRQWRLGETLTHRGVTIVFNRATASGGYVIGVRARFADGAVQPMNEAKLVYDCASNDLVHVVITSAKAAAPA